MPLESSRSVEAEADAGDAAAPPESESRRGRSRHPFVRIRHPGSFAAILNLGRGAARLVLLTTPDSPGGDAAIDVVRALLQRTSSTRLRAYVVFTPGASGTSRLEVLARLRLDDDPRMIVVWDEAGAVERAFGVHGPSAPVRPRLLLYAPAAPFVAGDSTATRVATVPAAAEARRALVEAFAADVARMLEPFGRRAPLPVTPDG